MEIEKQKAIIEAILFAAGRVIKINELMGILELSSDDVVTIIDSMKEEYKNSDRGIEIIRVEDGYQLTTKKEMYEYLYPIFDKRSKPNLTQASMETLAIIAYNPKVTRAEIESIRGVSADACIYKLLEYGLIQEAGKSDLPGKPMTYTTSNEFLKMFGYTSLNDLPELPRYKLDENQQIVIDDLVENNSENEEKQEAPEPKREEQKEYSNNDEE
jgi:segregation and condensation protein B